MEMCVNFASGWLERSYIEAMLSAYIRGNRVCIRLCFAVQMNLICVGYGQYQGKNIHVDVVKPALVVFAVILNTELLAMSHMLFPQSNENKRSCRTQLKKIHFLDKHGAVSS